MLDDVLNCVAYVFLFSFFLSGPLDRRTRQQGSFPILERSCGLERARCHRRLVANVSELSRALPTYLLGHRPRPRNLTSSLRRFPMFVPRSPPSPIIQRTPAITRQFVYLSLFLAILLYAHFVYVVITTITREIGVPCFVVRPRKFASGSVEPGAGAGGREAQRRTEDMAEAVRIEREKAALGGKFAKGQ